MATNTSGLMDPWQPGQSGNPKGRPRKLLRKVCEELQIDLGPAIPVSDKLEFVNRMLDMPIGELQDIATDPRAPSWMVMVASAIRADIRSGKITVLSELLDRVIGRPALFVSKPEQAGAETEKKPLQEWTDYEILQEEARLAESEALRQSEAGVVDAEIEEE